MQQKKMEASAVAYSTLRDSLVKAVFTHIDKMCEMAE